MCYPGIICGAYSKTLHIAVTVAIAQTTGPCRLPFSHSFAINKGPVRRRALKPKRTLIVQLHTRRLIPSISQQQCGDAMSGDRDGHVSDGGTVIRVRPKITNVVLASSTDGPGLGQVEKHRCGCVERVDEHKHDARLGRAGPVLRRVGGVRDEVGLKKTCQWDCKQEGSGSGRLAFMPQRKGVIASPTTGSWLISMISLFCMISRNCGSMILN